MVFGCVTGYGVMVLQTAWWHGVMAFYGVMAAL